jgi:hypothetical protein
MSNTGGGGAYCLMVWSLEKHPLQDTLKCEAGAMDNDKNSIEPARHVQNALLRPRCSVEVDGVNGCKRLAVPERKVTKGV